MQFNRRPEDAQDWALQGPLPTLDASHFSHITQVNLPTTAAPLFTAPAMLASSTLPEHPGQAPTQDPLHIWDLCQGHSVSVAPSLPPLGLCAETLATPALTPTQPPSDPNLFPLDASPHNTTLCLAIDVGYCLSPG